jgi:SAM-dependent methyltransferase
MDEPAVDVTAAMTETYDHYYASDEYRLRYPVPNYATLDYVMTRGASRGTNILDFGCGNGRYGMALLERTQASITGYDISRASLAEFEAVLQRTSYRDRVTLIHGELEKLDHVKPHDVVLMLFGVLSHIGTRAKRLDALRKIRSLITPNGKLILSVPSIYRRRPMELLKFWVQRRLGLARAPQNEPGNIFFSRAIHGKPVVFFYHLYSVRRLREELALSGFKISECAPESFLPEWLVTQSPLAHRLDSLVLRILPASLGYGIRVTADPV